MKLPAYSKPLLAARRSGAHPAQVTVLFGEDWHVAEGIPRLAVKPGAALGLDWRCVAGLPVELIDRRPRLDPTSEDTAELFRLAGEIARESAMVMIEIGGWRCCAHVQAHLDRIFARPMAWPQWWSAETDSLNERNRRQWIREAEATLAQFAA